MLTEEGWQRRRGSELARATSLPDRVRTAPNATAPAIAHIKNWRIMASRYRGHLLYRFENVVFATAGLQALNDSLSGRKLSFARFKK
jgi:hypothetical protein